MKKLVSATRMVTVHQVYLKEVEIPDDTPESEILTAADAALLAVEPMYHGDQNRLPWVTTHTHPVGNIDWVVGETGDWITSIGDLCEHFGADEPHGLNRRIHKDTRCGASISIYLSDGRTFHNGGDWPFAEEIDATGLDSFTIQTIVEGSDATVDSLPFTIPCRVSEVDAWMEEMEAEAARLWEEANGDEGDDEEEGEEE